MKEQVEVLRVADVLTVESEGSVRVQQTCARALDGQIKVHAGGGGCKMRTETCRARVSRRCVTRAVHGNPAHFRPPAKICECADPGLTRDLPDQGSRPQPPTARQAEERHKLFLRLGGILRRVLLLDRACDSVAAQMTEAVEALTMTDDYWTE